MTVVRAGPSRACVRNNACNCESVPDGENTTFARVRDNPRQAFNSSRMASTRASNAASMPTAIADRCGARKRLAAIFVEPARRIDGQSGIAAAAEQPIQWREQLGHGGSGAGLIPGYRLLRHLQSNTTVKHR